MWVYSGLKWEDGLSHFTFRIPRSANEDTGICHSSLSKIIQLQMELWTLKDRCRTLPLFLPRSTTSLTWPLTVFVFVWDTNEGLTFTCDYLRNVTNSAVQRTDASVLNKWVFSFPTVLNCLWWLQGLGQLECSLQLVLFCCCCGEVYVWVSDAHVFLFSFHFWLWACCCLSTSLSILPQEVCSLCLDGHWSFSPRAYRSRSLRCSNLRICLLHYCPKACFISHHLPEEWLVSRDLCFLYLNISQASLIVKPNSLSSSCCMLSFKWTHLPTVCLKYYYYPTLRVIAQNRLAFQITQVKWGMCNGTKRSWAGCISHLLLTLAG